MKVRLFVELEYEPKPSSYLEEPGFKPPEGLELADRVVKHDGSLETVLLLLSEGVYPGEVHINVMNDSGHCVAAKSTPFGEGT